MTFGYYFVMNINGEKITIRGDGHRSRDQSNRLFAVALNDCGYRPPRFWQFWRWGEQKPSRAVISLMRRERKWV